MAPDATVQEVEEGDEFIHVRFRDPDDFDEIRTPDWAKKASQSISKGSEVRTGRKTGSDEWMVQSVLIEKNVGAEKAEEQAKRILDEIES